jgi:hypothetical protein
MSQPARWLQDSPTKRVLQVTAEGDGFIAILVEQQSDGSGREACRATAMTMRDAIERAGQKLKS